LSVGVTPIVSHGARSRRVSWTSWVEMLLSLAAMASLWPLFSVVAGDTLGRDARFAEGPRVATMGSSNTGFPSPSSGYHTGMGTPKKR
jgi:hypothetical protein